MKAMISRFKKWLISKLKEDETPEYKIITGRIELGYLYRLTMRSFEELVKYSKGMRDDKIIIGGGEYDLITLARLTQLGTITVTMHETGSCMVLMDPNLPDLKNAWASDQLFKERITF